MNKNLPIIKKNTELTLSKTRSLINVTSKILSNKKKFEGLIEKENNALVDDSWMERLWAWADENDVPKKFWKHSLFNTGLPRNKIELLEITRVSFKSLKNLSKEIANLTNLESLDLNRNKLIELPKEIGTMSKLKKLDVSYNSFITLPKEIGNLTNLKKLNLFDNKLKELPKEIVNLTNLTTLNLELNPLILTKEQKDWILNLEENSCHIDYDDDLFNRTAYDEIPF